jgi:hypothetical protein
MQPYPVLEFDATFDGTQHSGRFEFLGGENGQAEVVGRGETGLLLDNALDNALGLLGAVTGDGVKKRRSLDLDIGGGQFVHEIVFALQPGVTKADGTRPVWGTGTETTVTAYDATAADVASEYQEIFLAYWERAAVDSTAPGTLQWGPRSDGGPLDPLPVTIRSPTLTVPVGENRVRGTIGLVATLDGSQPADARQNTPR